MNELMLEILRLAKSYKKKKLNDDIAWIDEKIHAVENGEVKNAMRLFLDAFSLTGKEAAQYSASSERSIMYMAQGKYRAKGIDPILENIKKSHNIT